MAVVHTGKKDPACSTNRATDKKVVDACSGYFKGIKASYAIFDGAEGSQVGDDLAMYSDRLEKVFEDNPSTLDSVKLMAPLQEFDWRPGCENPLMLRYECVYLTPCPLCLNRKQCWGSIQLATGVTEKSPNDCGGYKANEASDPGGILYSVDVVLHSKGGGGIRATPVSKATKCYAAEQFMGSSGCPVCAGG